MEQYISIAIFYFDIVLTFNAIVFFFFFWSRGVICSGVWESCEDASEISNPTIPSPHLSSRLFNVVESHVYECVRWKEEEE